MTNESRLFGLEAEQEAREGAVKEVVELLKQEFCPVCCRLLIDGQMYSYDVPPGGIPFLCVQCECGNWGRMEFQWFLKNEVNVYWTKSKSDGERDAKSSQGSI